MSLLFVDCQIFQTDAYNRGMGKYSLSLLQAYLDKAVRPDIVLIFNKHLPLPAERAKRLAKITHNAKKLSLDLPVELVKDTENKYAHAVDTLTAAVQKISGKQRDVSYLVLSPFFVQFAAPFPALQHVRKAVIVYDIIPQHIWKKLHIFPDELYYRHFSILRDADFLMTISEAVRNDMIDLIGVPAEKVYTIDGGPFESGKPVAPNLPYKYILYPSAPIIHKNNDTTAKAFVIFLKQQQEPYRLLLTSNFDDETKLRIRKICPEVEFTGNVSDEELTGLYQHSEGVLFSSVAEGLGMPVLEGVLQDKPVACSDIPVLKEISNQAFYFFEPSNPTSIAASLSEMVSGVNWQRKHVAYAEVKKKYTWQRTAAIMSEVLKKPVKRIHKQQLRIVAPDPRVEKGSAKLIEVLYMGLSEHFDTHLELQRSHGTVSPSFVPYIGDTATKGSHSLFISSRTKLPKDFAVGDVHIAVIRSFQLARKDTHTILLRAKSQIENKTLDIKSWRYLRKSGRACSQVSHKELVEMIKEKVAK